MRLGRALPVRRGCAEGCSAEMLSPRRLPCLQMLHHFAGSVHFITLLIASSSWSQLNPRIWGEGGRMWGELIITALCLNTARHFF